MLAVPAHTRQNPTPVLARWQCPACPAAGGHPTTMAAVTAAAAHKATCPEGATTVDVRVPRDAIAHLVPAPRTPSPLETPEGAARLREALAPWGVVASARATWQCPACPAGGTAPADVAAEDEAAHAAACTEPVPSDPRPGWDEWAIGIATAVAARADCTRRQVGAVVLDVDNRVIGVGYNGAPSGDPGCLTAGACPRGQRTTAEVAPGSSYDTGAGACVANHAEANALLHSDPVRRRGGTLAITCAPCDGCHRLIRGSGVARVVWPGGGFTL